MRKNLPLATIRVLLLCVAAAIALITECGIIPARAGDDPGELLNYSFAVWLGSGVYKVKSADKRFAVLRAPSAYTLRHAQYDKAAFLDKLGFRLLLPALVAVEDETDTGFTFGSAAFVPGLEVQIPINKYWTLKPYGQFGAGKDTAGGDPHYIYGGGGPEAWSAFPGKSLISESAIQSFWPKIEILHQRKAVVFRCWKPVWMSVTPLDSAFKIGRSMPVFSSCEDASSTGWTFLQMVAIRKESIGSIISG